MRSIPLATIPGCREYPFEYERYPKKTVALHFSSLPTYEAAAEFYSYLAFPDPLEEKQRKKYSLALSRWAVLEVGKYDKTWNTTEQMIRPTIFSQPEKLYLNIYKRGSIKLWQRAQFAFMMLLPDLVDEIFGDGQSSRRYSVGNIAFTVSLWNRGKGRTLLPRARRA